MKNACASESCPVTPVSSVRPIAAIAAAMANSPACSQNASRYCGSQSRRPTSARAASLLGLDTVDLAGAEQARRQPQQDREEHDVGDDVGEPAAEERQLVGV